MAVSLAAHAGPWQIADGFCQTQSQDGQFMVRIKPDSIGIIEQVPNCNGRGEFPMTGSNVVFNQTSYPSSAFCTHQTQYRAIQIIPSTKDIAAVIATLKNSGSMPVSTFGTQFEIDASGFASTCAAIINQKVADFDPQEAYQRDMARMGYKQDEHGQWQKQSRFVQTDPTTEEINANEAMKRHYAEVKKEALEAKAKADRENDERRQSASATLRTEEEVNAINEQRRQAAERRMQISPAKLTDTEMQRVLTAARQAYREKSGVKSADTHWGPARQLPDSQYQKQPVRVLQYEVFNPGFKTYDTVKVFIGKDNQVVGTEVNYPVR